MEGCANKSIAEVRKMTIRQARIAVMNGKQALQLATESYATEIRRYVDKNRDNWMPIGELKKLTPDQLRAREKRISGK